VIRVKLKLFAYLRERLGKSEEEIELPPGTKVGVLWERIREQIPGGGSFRVLFALNGEYVDGNREIKDGDEVTFIPPVSGGEEEIFEITPEKISVEETIKKVMDVEAGAVSVFLGTVRRHSREREVKYLQYEAYLDMAKREFAKIAKTIKEKWNVRKIAITHRVGRLEVGEISVVIAVSAPHRGDAFEASRFAIEALKKTVPIWKKEVWDGGEEWIQGS